MLSVPLRAALEPAIGDRRSSEFFQFSLEPHLPLVLVQKYRKQPHGIASHRKILVVGFRWDCVTLPVK